MKFSTLLIILFVSIQLFSQQSIEFKSKDGHKVNLIVKSTDPKDASKVNIWLGGCRHADNFIEPLGFSLYNYKRYLINFRAGLGFKVDGTLFLLRQTKDSEMYQKLDYEAGKFYAGMAPISKNDCIGIRYGSGYTFDPILNKYSVAHLKSGVSFVRSKFGRLSNPLKSRDIIGATRFAINLDVIYYFRYKYFDSELINTNKNIGLELNAEGFVSKHNNFNRGLRYIVGVGTSPFTSLSNFKIAPHAGIFIDLGIYKDNKKYNVSK